MIRFQPLEHTKPQLPQKFLRSVGGDELNVAVALSLLGVKSKWVSVVPKGPLGQAVMSCSEISPLLHISGLTNVEGDLGIFTVLPESKSVHYQRSSSAFARCADQLRWPVELGDASTASWFHVSGITPLLGDPAKKSWLAALQQARHLGLPTSLDLNWRKQLGTLSDLWSIVMPVLDTLELLILSVDQVQGLAELLGTDLSAADDDAFFAVMSRLQQKVKCRRVAMCRKTRDEGIQCRWSLMVEADIQCKSAPIYHVPKDECGGGSAWAAGIIIALQDEPQQSQQLIKALRHADLVAALCQNTEGDFSHVTVADLRAAEASIAAGTGEWGVWETKPHHSQLSQLSHVPKSPKSLPSTSIEVTLEKMKKASLLAIFRVKGSAQVAIDRGVELAQMGVKAMEVTIDSPDWKEILSGLRERLDSDVLLGIGTVMDDTVSEVAVAQSLGASFALSPIDPIGFIDVCKSLGVLAVPSAFTSNECWSMHRRGARLIKLFHAGLTSPMILKHMLDIKPLGDHLNILPSGSVSPKNASEWLKAGAVVVGMGSNLVGKDISLKPGTPEFHAAVEDWKNTGRPTVEKLIKEIKELALLAR